MGTERRGLITLETNIIIFFVSTTDAPYPDQFVYHINEVSCANLNMLAQRF